MLRDERGEGGAQVLGAAVAVKDQWARGASVAQGAGEDGTRHARRAVARERPGDDAPRVRIHDDGEIAPLAADAEIRDIADPHLIRPGDLGLPEAIGVLRKARPNPRLGAIAADGFRASARGAHQAGDAAPTHGPAGVHQLAMEARTAVPLVMHRKASNDLRGQGSVLGRVRAVLPTPPRVEPAGRDVIAATERSDFVAFVLRDEGVDEGEPVTLRAAQNRMAFFRRSCSSLSSAYFRSSAWSCAISRAGPGGAAFGSRPRRHPSFTSFRHFDSMKGCISSAAATVCT